MNDHRPPRARILRVRSNRHDIAEMAELLAAGWQHDRDDIWLHPSRNQRFTRTEAIAQKRREQAAAGREPRVVPYPDRPQS